MTAAKDAEPAPLLAVGTRVEVRNGFDGTWEGGFSVADHGADGYRIRRRSDDVVLPVPFERDTVRRERRSMWWV